MNTPMPAPVTPPPPRFDLRDALKGSAKATLLTLGLAFPILAYRAEADIHNELVLQSRWFLVFAAVLIVFALRFLSSFIPRRSRRAWPERIDRPKPSTAALARFAAWAGAAALAAFPVAALVALGPAASLKWIDNFGVQILIYVMLGWGLNIVVGLAGLLDLGCVAFYAVGAYSYALLSGALGWPFWVCLPVGGLLAALCGALLGLPVLRLRGDYLAIVTLAFGEIVRIVLTNWTEVTNGDAGLGSFQKITFFGWPFIPGPHGFAALFGLKYLPIHRVMFLFYLVLTLAFLTNFITLRLRCLPIGRAWEALREDEIACRSLGMNVVTTKLSAFALGAFVAGLAGAVFAARQNFVSPSSFTFIESATILAIVVLGGRGSQLGVALAAIFIVGGSELLRELDGLKAIFGPAFDPTQYRMLIVGFAMVVMMNWKPRGLIAVRKPTILVTEPKPIAGALAQKDQG
jgi:branched-chain amino acid transport system permease protein